jgi:hypothetical protein
MTGVAMPKGWSAAAAVLAWVDCITYMLGLDLR